MGRGSTSHEIGLFAGLAIGKFFYGMEDLHFGYWPVESAPAMADLKSAQLAFSRFLLSNFPEGTQRILDVGAGGGNLAAMMLEEGYQVDCVSPSNELSQRIKARLGDQVTIYRCRFEDIETDRHYDLILFSESFQYVDIRTALQISQRLLNPGGQILICDFFRNEMTNRGVLSGGHRWPQVMKVVSELGLTERTNLDISARMVPTLELWEQFLRDVAIPLGAMSASYMQSKYPLLTRFVAWKYKRRLAKINRIYLSDKSWVQDFLDHKTYRLLIYQLGN